MFTFIWEFLSLFLFEEKKGVDGRNVTLGYILSSFSYDLNERMLFAFTLRMINMQGNVFRGKQLPQHP